MNPQDNKTEEKDDLPFSPWIGCLGAVLLGLMAAFLVFQITRLIYFGEVRFGGPSLAPNRIWLVQGAENAGIMISTTQVMDGSMEEDWVCLRTRVQTWLWRRDDSTPITGYCLCYERSNGSWNQQGACQQEVAP